MVVDLLVVIGFPDLEAGVLLDGGVGDEDSLGGLASGLEGNLAGSNRLGDQRCGDGSSHCSL